MKQKVRNHTKKINGERKEIDEYYRKYNQNTNMSYSELENWSLQPCSKMASLDNKPIERNLMLKSKPKSLWTIDDVAEAKKVISFNKRMIENKCGKDRNGCGCGRDISLKNWALNPKKI